MVLVHCTPYFFLTLMHIKFEDVQAVDDQSYIPDKQKML